MAEYRFLIPYDKGPLGSNQAFELVEELRQPIGIAVQNHCNSNTHFFESSQIYVTNAKGIEKGLAKVYDDLFRIIYEGNGDIPTTILGDVKIEDNNSHVYTTLRVLSDNLDALMTYFRAPAASIETLDAISQTGISREEKEANLFGEGQNPSQILMQNRNNGISGSIEGAILKEIESRLKWTLMY